MNDTQDSAGIMAAYEKAVQRLGKWRTVFVGWMIGTKGVDEPGVKAYRDRADAVLMMRVEINALTALLVQKGVFTTEEFMAQIVEECDHKQRELEALFPGYTATDIGIRIDPHKAAETNRRMGFPP